MVHLMTLTEYAKKRGVSRRLVADVWPKRHPDLFPEPEGTRKPSGAGRPAAVYPVEGLDRVWLAEQQRETGGAQEVVTLVEYAKRVGLSVGAVEKWRAQHPDVWPAPVGKRRQAYTYEVGGLDRVWRRVRGLPDPVGSPGDLLDWEGVCAYLGPVVSRSTMRWRWSRGLWPAGVVGGDGVERWARWVVEEVQVGLSRGTKNH